MDAITVTFTLADWITKGLADGSLERIGGVIRAVGTKHIVAWLRETGKITSQPKGQRQGIMLPELTEKILLAGSAASVLNLGVSVIGFSVVIQSLKELERRLEKTQKVLDKIDRKIDISFYANFQAALDLAVNAFTMDKPENRQSLAVQAIDRFVEAQYYYTQCTDAELEQGSQIAHDYLLTLSLAYLAEARCYLELEEITTANRRLKDGATALRPRLQKYVKLLLTSNPAAYLQSDFKGQIDLRRLTRIYQWIDPSLDENAVFELQRKNLFKMLNEPDKWVDSLPKATWQHEVDAPFGWHFFGMMSWESYKPLIYPRLPKAMEAMESMIENNRRFEAYQTEAAALTQLGISFHEWLKLTPPTEQRPEGAELMYIIPAQPLAE